MRPLTYTRPKGMLPLANLSILEHLVVEIREAGIREFVLVIGYCGECKKYFGDGTKWGVHISYVNQRAQLGEANALWEAQPFAGSHFLVVNSDIMFERTDLARLLLKGGIALGLVPVEKTEEVGVAEVCGGHVVRLYEKVRHPPSNLANTGIYLFTSDIFSPIAATPLSPRGEYEFPDAIQKLIDNGTPVHYELIPSWLAVSYPWDLLQVNELLLSRMESQNLGEIEPNVVLKGAVRIGAGSTVRSGSYVVGPVTIGDDCDIGPNCYLRPYTVIGAHCHIGKDVKVENSIIMSGTRIYYGSYVGDSIIGANCNLGAGTKVANLRLDRKEISALGVNTGRTKMGAIRGDGVQTGVNSCLNVGCAVGNNCFIGPGVVAQGTILPYSRLV